MLSHPQPPEYSWLPDLCVQKLSLPDTPCLRLFDYRSPDTTVALMRVQAPQDWKGDMTMERRNVNTSKFSNHKCYAYTGLLLIRKSLKSPCGMSSSTTILCEENKHNEQSTVVLKAIPSLISRLS